MSGIVMASGSSSNYKASSPLEHETWISSTWPEMFIFPLHPIAVQSSTAARERQCPHLVSDVPFFGYLQETF